MLLWKFGNRVHHLPDPTVEEKEPACSNHPVHSAHCDDQFEQQNEVAKKIRHESCGK